MEELIEKLEALRISDIAFFGQSLECQRRYERANAMLDDCLEIVWKWLQEKDLLNE